MHKSEQPIRSQVRKLTLVLTLTITHKFPHQGYTAAQLATDSVSKLLAEEPANGGIDIEYQLLEASKAGDLELVKKIVNLHAHIVNCRDLDGRHSTPLHFAAGYNRDANFCIVVMVKS